MHPEMLAELKQLKMKVAGDDQGYEKVRSRLPQTGKVVDYIGLAPQLTDQAVKRINKFIKGKI
jgi:hypothetical protein